MQMYSGLPEWGGREGPRMLREGGEWEEVQVGCLLRGQKREKNNGNTEENHLLFCPTVGEPSTSKNKMQKRG